MTAIFRGRETVPRQEPAAKSDVNETLTARFIAKGGRMLISVLVTFLVVILVLYLINLLPIDGRAKQICRVVVIILGVISLLKYIAVI
jgi:Na+/melibiose symporter-like transporter